MRPTHERLLAAAALALGTARICPQGCHLLIEREAGDLLAEAVAAQACEELVELLSEDVRRVVLGDPNVELKGDAWITEHFDSTAEGSPSTS